jgi:hypothetical protein
MPDMWYSPEAFGLELIGYVDWSSGHYEFDYSAVWYHAETNRWFYDRDSGCSCPSPFQVNAGLRDLEQLWDPFNQLKQKLEKIQKTAYAYETNYPEQVAALLEKVAVKLHERFARER